ncbi:non-hydrolyzing UDP-N-acetylglucosamine 2-epimerase [Polaribacter sp. Hel1_85]|uniref:non-hydrolyzing UDP-N-acetylglucosamine 2-epimerase n=1 Tax=Polaribacter sp. Hel1_85 TaxID=1250005 RepID=UPI00052D8444|nr:UDP-N-acetylglucosamine 2-epimerase (non-hydrolyzing) [Polaribacter sp. Hel1_85]KGL63251.1 UDP-N-acetylglucosamine 2-epimerase [Polaribacter sp. Hel1_85]
MIKIIAVVGARPQFIKHFSFEKSSTKKIDLITIHTGQHYDENMSAIFFNELGMKKPKYKLNTGGGSHGLQTGKMIIEIEEILLKEKPDGIVVYGDTNSTLAASLAGSKLAIPIFHIEAGLRSYNKKMPEEINRVLTDHVSNLLFVPSQLATKNLQKEGVLDNVIEVGDIMKDLVFYIKKNNHLTIKKPFSNFYYATIHRPYNTDDKERLSLVLKSLNSMKLKVVMSIHPRTTKLMNQYNIKRESYSNIHFINPQSYFDNLSYLNSSNGLLTDSGGMQKEAYWLKKQCVTIRKETEWIETLVDDKNKLIFDELSDLKNIFTNDLLNWNDSLYGKGNTAEIIVDTIVKYYK